jgi:hypothetical protein
MDDDSVVNDIDPVVRALVAAIAVLEDLRELYSHEHMATNALEQIAYDLGKMNDEQRRDFEAAISRIADAHDREAPGTGDWVRDLPRKLGAA